MERQIGYRQHRGGGGHQRHEQSCANEEMLAHALAAYRVKNEIAAAEEDDEQHRNSNPVDDRHRALLRNTMPIARRKTPLAPKGSTT